MDSPWALNLIIASDFRDVVSKDWSLPGRNSFSPSSEVSLLNGEKLTKLLFEQELGLRKRLAKDQSRVTMGIIYSPANQNVKKNKK